MSNKVLIWIVAIAVIIIAGIMFFGFGGSSPQTAQAPGTPASNPAAAPAAATSPAAPANPPSGNPDTIVSNLLGDTPGMTATPVESDPSLTASDTDITGGADQALSANSF